MKPDLIASACLCALLATAVVHAQPATPRPLVGGHGNNIAAFIAQHDEDADGRVTWEEFEAFRLRRFRATDADGNGTVDVEEYVQEFDDRMRQQLEQGRGAQVEQARRRFAALDADRDGRVDRAEFDASGERVWSEGLKALASRDASATGGEERTAEAAARFDRAGDRLALPSSHTAEGFLALYDGDGDGKVDRAEFDRARQAQFQRTDGDADGALSLDEYLAEFEDRLDRHIATLASGSDRQTRVRFAALDTDKDGRMTFEEYQASGRRLFEAADRNRDGVVDGTDAALPPPVRPARAQAARPSGG